MSSSRMAQSLATSTGIERNGFPTNSTSIEDISSLPSTYQRQADSDTESDYTSHHRNGSAVSRAPLYDPSLLPNGSRSLSLIALQAFGLGILLAGCVSMVIVCTLRYDQIWRLPAFFGCLSIFHFLEFWTTARYNVPNVRASSFLLWNNREYNYAHALATGEMLVLYFFFPGVQTFGVSAVSVTVGSALIVLGQVARSAAMITAGTNFNHIPARAHKQGHELVTTGIYSWLRHPSYFGFFWWALGTQLLIGNKVCLLGYAIVLWRFFQRRIIAEERYLVNFFGKDYEAFRDRVGTGIPFIR